MGKYEIMDDRIVKLVRKYWQSIRSEIENALFKTWSEPELPLMEYKSAAYLSGWLKKHGFNITLNAGGLPTAFVANYGDQPKPAIGLLSEYDAMPGLSNEAVAEYKPNGQFAGHGCGHNQIGSANVGAAIAARYIMEELKIPGRITVVGCPAEEIVYGKVVLLDKGIFNNLDAILTSHADYQNGVLSRPCQSVFNGEFVFSGISSHTGKPQSRNALEAVELAVQSIERLRGHHFPEASVEHIIRNAGTMPNITPKEARLWIYVRHQNYEYAQRVYHFIREVAETSSKLTETYFTEQFISACHGYMPNDVLANVLFKNMELVGPPAWKQEDLDWMRQLAGNFQAPETFEIDLDIDLYTDGIDPYGQDDGEVSWHVPLGRINWAIPKQIPLHSWATTALSGSIAGHRGALMTSETLALATIDLLKNPDIIDHSQKELEERLGKSKVPKALYGGFKTLTENPQAFWNSTWTL
jgi:aminobenzoyl-glutamate utilization protein B